MRKTAKTEHAADGVHRVMIYEVDGGAYLFLYRTLDDGPCDADEWYGTTPEAEEACGNRYGISSVAWQFIAEPLEGCQDDWIVAVRVKGSEVGTPEWGKFEK